MYTNFRDFLKKELADIEAAGLYKKERVITTPQRADIKVNAGEEVLNFCANNYLGLSDNTRLIEAAKKAMDTHGYGMSSVRFICGTQDLHKQLEAAISDYFHTEDTILYAACFDANGGLFEPLFTEEDAIISDALNHASIIDGVRLCKAKRYRYANADMADLERCLQEAQAQRHDQSKKTRHLFCGRGWCAEINLGCGRDGLLVLHRETLLCLVAEHLRRQVARERAHGDVVFLYCLDEAVARHGYSIFGALKLGL